MWLNKIVAPTHLDDPAILRVIVEYKGKHGQTITLKCFYPPTILHHRAIKGAL
jgi:hypothetical protein